MELVCKHCGNTFSRQEGLSEAELAWRRGEELGDYVCPVCGSGDRMVEEIWE